MNFREQKRSRLDRPANVAELTVANVTAKQLEHNREYAQLPVVSVERNPNRNGFVNTTPSGNNRNPPMNPSVTRIPTVNQSAQPRQYERKSGTSYQQHRYNKQGGKNSKQQRRNHSFHFNKNDYIQEDDDESCGKKKTTLEYSAGISNKHSLGKLNKNRSFHCTTNSVELSLNTSAPACVETSTPDRKLLGIRKHWIGQKKTGKSGPVPSEKDTDPIYDEINLAESKKLEQDLLLFNQPVYCARRDKTFPAGKESFLPVTDSAQSFNLKLNENNRIVYDDSPPQRPLPGNLGNKSFVYKQKLYASSPSTQQKILRRSKSGLIESEAKTEDLVRETARLSIDGSPDEKNPKANRHLSPKKGRFYKHHNLDRNDLGFQGRPDTERDENAPRHKSDVASLNLSKTPSKATGENLVKSPGKKCIEKRHNGEVIKQSRVVRNLKTFLQAQQETNEGAPKFTELSEGVKTNVHDLTRRDGEVVGENNGGVINNHIYINTREHHLCCINVLEHTLCCHSNVNHDAFCCQGNQSAKCPRSQGPNPTSPSVAKPNNLIVNVIRGDTKVNNSTHALNNQSTSLTARPDGVAGPEVSCKSCSHGHGHRHSGGHCSLHYLKHKYRDENEKLAREQVIKWLENDFTADDGKETLDREFLRCGKFRGKKSPEKDCSDETEMLPHRSDEEDLLSGESESEDERKGGSSVQLHKHVHHHFYHFDSVLV